MPLCPDRKIPKYLGRTLTYAEEVDAISNYLRYQRYPPKFSDNNKRWLRRRSKSFTVLEKGDMFYLQKDGRMCVAESEEQKRIVMKAHQGLGDSHFGRDKTLKSIVRRYYWRSIYKDVCALTETCPTCKLSPRSGPKCNLNRATKQHSHANAESEEKSHVTKIRKQRTSSGRSQKQANQSWQEGLIPESPEQRVDIPSPGALHTHTPGGATQRLQGDVDVPESTEQTADVLIRPAVPHTSASKNVGMSLQELVNVEASSRGLDGDLIVPTAIRLASILEAATRVPNRSRQSHDQTCRSTSRELLDSVKVAVKEAVREANSEVHAKLDRLMAEVTTMKEELGAVKQSVWHLESSVCDVSNSFTCDKEEIVSEDEQENMTLGEVLA